MLYGDPDLCAYLHKNFVMHWSSERPVPKITVDYGDGRVTHTTITGNSVHVALNHYGEVVGVMPGLMDAETFTAFCGIAQQIDKATADIDYLENRQDAIIAKLQEFTAAFARVKRDAILTFANSSGRFAGNAIAANSRSMSKSGLQSGSLRPFFPRASQALGRSASKMASQHSFTGETGGSVIETRPRTIPAREALEVVASKAMTQMAITSAFGRVNTSGRILGEGNLSALPLWAAEAIAATAETPELGQAKVLAFRASLYEDSFNAATSLSSGAIAQLEGCDLADFDAIMDRLYANVFLTPRSDPWLGLKNPLAWDGVIR